MRSITPCRAIERSSTLFLLMILILGSITQTIAVGPVNTRLKTADAYVKLAGTTSDVLVLRWDEIAANTIAPLGPPFEAARRMAMVQVAVFEAVNAITGKYQPYLGTLSVPQGAAPEAAAVQAAHNVLRNFYPQVVPFYGMNTTPTPLDLDAELTSSLGAIQASAQAISDGAQVGAAAAAAVIANRTGDGSSPLGFYFPTTADPFEWQQTPGCNNTGGRFFNWPNLRPFGIESSSQFRSEPPPALNSGVYAQDFNELQQVGDINSPNRPQDRTDIARLYAAGPGHWTWNYVLLQIASTRSDEITDTARTMAVMNMAINDAYISGFESKYFYKTWRPVTAIPRGDEDGNKWTTVGSFTPLITTPCFPGYPSNHGSGSGAARTVLERVYGRFRHSIDVFHPGAPGIVRHYSDLTTITDDVADARVYGGIHFRFDQDAGERQGHAVGQYVYNNLLQKLGK